MFWFDVEGIYREVFFMILSSLMYYFLGLIIWGGMEWYFVYWILFGGMKDFGVIWYWVNEDDCDGDRKLGKIFVFV